MMRYLVILLLILASCKSTRSGDSTPVLTDNKVVSQNIHDDIPFIQETHDAFMVGEIRDDNKVRSIAVDRESNIWIATASGIFMKKYYTRKWEPVINGNDRGPAYSVACNADGDILLGTWNGIYRYRNNSLTREEGMKPPVSEICTDAGGDYALGPYGIWRYNSGKWVMQDYRIARSVKDAETDGNGDLWVATDAGLYLCKDGKTRLFQDTTELMSCYTRAIAFSEKGELWAGVLGGVSIRKEGKKIKDLSASGGIPSAWVNCITRAEDGTMWVGTDMGAVRYNENYTHSLRFSRRWLTDNKVNDIAFDMEGNAWIATENGVSEIRRQNMTLLDKETYFYDQLMTKHIREPWICGNLRLEVPGDTSTWRNTDDDNDGEYTGGYLAMESFRYAATGSEDARIKARRAFEFLKLLHDVTGKEGFFARTIVPADWTRVNDSNRSYTEREQADLLVEDPRYKPVETRWHLSADKKWKWKGDTSSDEMDGHMMGYFFYYEFAAGENEKTLIRNHVKVIVDNLIKNDFNLIDVDGTHTRWAVWSPEQLNGDPDWASEKALNSFEILAYLKFAAHITGDKKYEEVYRSLIDTHGYLENAKKLNSKNPAWQIYFDLTMEGYLFPILIKYEDDPTLRKIWLTLIEEWMAKQKSGENLINNLTYTIATGKKVNENQTLEFLRDAPLDLVDWRIDHTLREDVTIVRKPILEEIQISELPPASMRATVRWDKNPWSAVSGDPSQVREPNFWLWPYWMARYLGIIQQPDGLTSTKMNGQKDESVKFGLCTDVHLPTMHDSEYRLTNFINRMKSLKPDFILEMGDFGTPDKEYAYLFDIWNSFPGDKYHVIGNHEMDDGYTLAQALEYLKMSSPFYSFDKNGFHFIVLNGNDKKNNEAKGYKQFIGPDQVEWLKKDLAESKYPIVIFSHQGLLFYHGPDEDYGVENYKEIEKIFEDHNALNPGKKVIACFNGHTHTDNAEKINGIYYVTITSMSYHWLGDKYTCVRYSDEVDKKFKWIKYTAPFKEPLYTVVEISTKGYIKIAGMKTEWVGLSPFDLGYPSEYKKYLKPSISERNLEFTLK